VPATFNAVSDNTALYTFEVVGDVASRQGLDLEEK
jgi:hypothetical protein